MRRNSLLFVVFAASVMLGLGAVLGSAREDGLPGYQPGARKGDSTGPRSVEGSSSPTPGVVVDTTPPAPSERTRKTEFESIEFGLAQQAYHDAFSSPVSDSELRAEWRANRDIFRGSFQESRQVLRRWVRAKKAREFYDESVAE